jgi:hypothetical protein
MSRSKFGGGTNVDEQRSAALHTPVLPCCDVDGLGCRLHYSPLLKQEREFLKKDSREAKVF